MYVNSASSNSSRTLLGKQSSVCGKNCGIVPKSYVRQNYFKNLYAFQIKHFKAVFWEQKLPPILYSPKKSTNLTLWTDCATDCRLKKVLKIFGATIGSMLVTPMNWTAFYACHWRKCAVLTAFLVLTVRLARVVKTTVLIVLTTALAMATELEAEQVTLAQFFSKLRVPFKLNGQ